MLITVNTRIRNRLNKLSDEEWHQKITDDLALKSHTWDNITKYREYADGDQTCFLTTEMLEILGTTWDDAKEFCDNICDTIIAEARDRVRFLGWKCKNTSVQTWLDEFFKTSKVRSLSSEILYDCFRDGNHLVHTYFDNDSEQVKLEGQSWHNGVVGSFANYTPAGLLEYVIKDWIQDEAKDIYRRNIYYPGVIKKYISENGNTSWERYLEPEPDTQTPNVSFKPWPMVSERKDGTPLGVPYIHFINTGKGLKVKYGKSELFGGITGYQDDLNRISWDMTISSRMSGCPIYWGTGIGDDSEMKVGPGEIWTTESADATFGMISPGNQESNIKVYNLKARRVAQISRTPAHIITGAEWPSGEALMRSENPAIGKADSQIDGLNDAFILLAHRSIELFNTYGANAKTRLPEDPKRAMIMCKFAPTDRRDPLSQSTVISNLAERISDEKAMERMGYEADEIEENEKQKQVKKEEEFKRAQETALLTAKTRGDDEKGGGNNRPIKGSKDRGSVSGRPNGGRNIGE